MRATLVELMLQGLVQVDVVTGWANWEAPYHKTLSNMGLHEMATEGRLDMLGWGLNPTTEARGCEGEGEGS